MEKRILIYFLALVFVMSYASAQEKIVNGDFENADISMWTIATIEAATATLERSAVNPISGTNSLHVTITNAAISNRFLQLIQTLGVVDNKKYVITLKARASTNVTITMMMQQNHSLWGTITQKDINLTTTAQTFVDSVNNYEIGTDSDVKFTLWIGTLPTGTELWFDDVSIIESDAPPQEVGIKAPGTEKIVNGMFESSATPWSLQLNGSAAAMYNLSTENPIQGTTSAHITVTNSTGTASDIQFIQSMQVSLDKRYFIMYKARSSVDNVVIRAGIQEAHGSNNLLTPFKADTLLTTAKTFIDTSGYMAAVDNNVKFTIYLGNVGTAEVWIDFVSIIENTMAPHLPITIDAVRDGWYNGLTNPNDGKIYIPARAYLRDVGNDPGTNDNLSAIIWTAWDRDYLFFYAEVHDDIIRDNNATFWDNDRLELYFNPDPTIISTSGALAVAMSALGAGDVQDPGALDDLNHGSLCYANGTVWNATTADYSRRRTTDGYILEWRIPINAINNSTVDQRLSPGVGGKFGGAINVGDNDDTQRSHMIQWSSGMTNYAWTDPQQHGMVTFLADNKLKWEAISPQVPATYHNDSASVWYFGTLGPVSGVESTNNKIPTAFTLRQNYPNPFNPSTAISFSIPKRLFVSLKIYDLIGREIATIVSEELSAGNYSRQWNAANMSSGIYYYHLQAGSFAETKKLILLR